jgi:hypothetical protein
LGVDRADNRDEGPPGEQVKEGLEGFDAQAHQDEEKDMKGNTKPNDQSCSSH